MLQHKKIPRILVKDSELLVDTHLPLLGVEKNGIMILYHHKSQSEGNSLALK